MNPTKKSQSPKQKAPKKSEKKSKVAVSEKAEMKIELEKMTPKSVKENITADEAYQTPFGIALPFSESTMMLKNVKFHILESYPDQKSSEPTFSLVIDLENLEDEMAVTIEEIEEKMIKLALEQKKAIEKVAAEADLDKFDEEVKNPKMILKNSTNFNKDSFKLIREFEGDRVIFGKLYHQPKRLKITVPFWRTISKDGRLKKQEIKNKQNLLRLKMEGDVVIWLKQIFLGNKKAITCVVDEVLVRKEIKPPSAFADISDDESD